MEARGEVRAKRNEARDYFFAHLRDATENACMIWPYYTSPTGYGQVVIDGDKRAVHALACEAFHGSRPPGMQAAHGPCHNPSCWNGHHLQWKTNAENAADRSRDGTQQRGPKHPLAVLTFEMAEVVRARYAAGGVTQLALAAEFGISQQSVSNIVLRRDWPTVTKRQSV
jgi:hypothetical protein